MSFQQRKLILIDAGLVSTTSFLLSCLLLYGLIREASVVLLTPVATAAIVLGATFAVLIRGQIRRPWAYAWRALIAGVIAVFVFALCSTIILEMTAAESGYGTYGWFFGLAATFIGGCLIGAPLIPAVMGFVVAALHPSRIDHQGKGV